jgi:UrcA family protein
MTRLATKMLLLGGLAGLVMAGAAGAGTVDKDVPTLVVHYHADALDTDSGAQALYRLLAQAAEQVCPLVVNTRIVSGEVLKCRRDALNAAVSKIHNQRLAALHAAHMSKSG